MGIQSGNYGIRRNGLIAYWDPGNIKSIKSGQTTVKDLSGNGYDLTLLNNSTYSSSNKGILRFNGNNNTSNDEAQSTSFYDCTGDSSHSFCIWINPLEALDTRFFWHHRYCILLYKNSNGEIRYYLKASGNDVDQVIIDDIDNITNEWYHIACTYDGSFMRTYINGEPSGVTIKTGVLESGGYNTQISIGGDNGHYKSNEIGPIFVYNQGITAKDVKDIYNMHRARFGKPDLDLIPLGSKIKTNGLILNLDAEGYSGSGNWLDTSSLGGNHGTLVNGTSFVSSSPNYFDFDGTNDYVDTNNGEEFNLNGPFTIEVIGKFSTTPSLQTIVSKSNLSFGNPTTFLYELRIRNSALEICYSDGTTGARATIPASGASGAFDGNFHHIVGVIDLDGNSNGGEVYIDGVPLATERVRLDTVNSIRQNTETLKIGSGNRFPLDGQLNLVNMYSRNLSAEDVLNNYLFYKDRL